LSSAHQLGLSGSVKAKIIAYTAFDAVIGTVPLLGDAADFVFKSHKRSLDTIEKALARQARA
ncbi:MAG: DUF4112 domain-containing protein, partial [Oceanicaulis sp.]